MAKNGCIKIIREYEYEKYLCGKDIINDGIHLCKNHKNKKILNTT